MSATLRAYFSKGYWQHTFSVREAIIALLSSFGTLWLCVEIISFFSEDASTWLKGKWFIFFVFGIVFGLWENRPRHQIGCRLNSRDVLIKVRVGNLFQANDSLVVGCNTTFDTNIHSGIISKRSVQGQFTTRFYENLAHLDADIEKALENIPYEYEDLSRTGKKKVYPIGTTIKLRVRGRTIYLIAIAPLNNHGNAKGTFDDLKKSLPSLWEFISTQGDFGSISMPVLGSGYSRIPQPREVIIREILQSFIAACADKRPCESLTIVISERDLYQHEVNLVEIEAFIKHICKYTDLADPTGPGHGKPIVL